MENTFYMLLHRAFHAQRGYLRSFLGESGLGTGQPKLLVHLERQGPCSQRELAEYFEIDLPLCHGCCVHWRKAGL